MVCWHNCRGNSDKKKKNRPNSVPRGTRIFLRVWIFQIGIKLLSHPLLRLHELFSKGIGCFLRWEVDAMGRCRGGGGEREKQLTSFPQLGPHPAAIPTQALFLSFKPFQIFTLAWQFDKLRQMSRLAPWCFHHTGRGTNCKRLLAQR